MSLVPLARVERRRGHVTFLTLAETRLGEEVRLVGGPSSLGAWNVDQGIPLRTSASTYPVWSASVPFQQAEDMRRVEYKFVIVTPSHSNPVWEEGDNRELSLEGFLKEARPVITRFNERHNRRVCLERDSFACISGIPRSIPLRTMVLIWEVDCPFTQPGDDVVVAGSCVQLGRWRPESGLRLTTGETIFPKWYGYCQLPMDCTQLLSWNLAIVPKDGAATWEQAPERTDVLTESHPSHGTSQDVYMVKATFNKHPCDYAVTKDASTMSQAGSSYSCSTATSASGCRQSGSFDTESITTATSTPSCTTVSPLVSPTMSNMENHFDELLTGAAGKALWEESQDHEAKAAARHTFWSGARRLPKAKGRCEDACFIGADCLGVADGVGSMQDYARYGVDCEAYAENLLELSARALRAGCVNVKEAMATAENGVSTYGASTLTLARLQGSVLHIGNLGDSGFMVLRPKASSGLPGEYEVVHRSVEQQHAWNKPYQLMRVPPVLMARVPPGTRLDTVEDAEIYAVSVEHGDLVVLYTDGFSDNLHEKEILEVVCKEFQQVEGKAKSSTQEQFFPRPEKMARELALAAQRQARSETAEVPFVVSSREQGFPWTGGKEDDITVVVAWVVNDDVPRLRRSRS